MEQIDKISRQKWVIKSSSIPTYKMLQKLDFVTFQRILQLSTMSKFRGTAAQWGVKIGPGSQLEVRVKFPAQMRKYLTKPESLSAKQTEKSNKKRIDLIRWELSSFATYSGRGRPTYRYIGK